MYLTDLTLIEHAAQIPKKRTAASLTSTRLSPLGSLATVHR